MTALFSLESLRWGTFLLSVFLSGCASTISTPPGEVLLPPARWLNAPPNASGSAELAAWWKNFNNDELNSLVRQAGIQNLDVASGVARVRQVNASAVIAGASLLPQVSGTANASRQIDSGTLSNNSIRSAYNIGLNASYEIDFWGGNRATRDSARQALRASIHDLDVVRLTVNAGLASLWLQAVGLKERTKFAELSLQSSQRVLTLVEARTAAGAASPLELAQQRGLVASQKQTLGALSQQTVDTHTALALLLSRPVSGFTTTTESLASLRIPRPHPGMPSTLLTRRPDIARAEAQLMAADADIIAARAAMLPSFSLTGALSSGSNHFRSIINDPVYSVAAGLAAPIFNAGRLAAGKRLAEARHEELLIAYRSSILSAFSDVETALNAMGSLAVQSAAQSEAQAQAKRAFELAEIRYRSGAETLITLLDAQRTLYASQDEAVQLTLARLLASVALFKALGGGWEP